MALKKTAAVKNEALDGILSRLKAAQEAGRTGQEAATELTNRRTSFHPGEYALAIAEVSPVPVAANPGGFIGTVVRYVVIDHTPDTDAEKPVEGRQVPEGTVIPRFLRAPYPSGQFSNEGDIAELVATLTHAADFVLSTGGTLPRKATKSLEYVISFLEDFSHLTKAEECAAELDSWIPKAGVMAGAAYQRYVKQGDPRRGQVKRSAAGQAYYKLTLDRVDPATAPDFKAAIDDLAERSPSVFATYEDLTTRDA